jgi:hypothetical protein
MIYGAYSNPQTFWDAGNTFPETGINALFVHSGRVDSDLIARCHAQGAPVYAEFGTFRGDYLVEKQPDVAPIGVNGLPTPRTARFLGACPSNPRLLNDKRTALRALVRNYAVAGVWLDYLHFHCDFELPDPPLDQSCFCDHCLARFTRHSGIHPIGRTTAECAASVLAEHATAWTEWKCAAITEFAAEARQIVDTERPGTKLGIYSCPWTDDEYGGAIRSILGEDLDALHSVVDVFSPMVYQVKCGRPTSWVEKYTRWLVGRVTALNTQRGRAVEVWPIVEAEGASPDELETALQGALNGGATGVMFYALPHVAGSPEKLAAIKRVYRSTGN